MRLSVIIPTYQRAASLSRTLGTIAAQTCHSFEVIVVDQSVGPARADVLDVVRVIQENGLPVTYLWSEIRSSTSARNLGLGKASGDWVIFSDDDVDWPLDVVAKLLRKLEAEPSLAMVGARDLKVSQKPRSFFRRLPAALFLNDSLLPLQKGAVFASMQARYPQPVIGDMETEWATGYWFAVDRGLVQRHALSFDERMTRYAQAEDMLFSHQFYLASMLEGRRCIVSEQIAVHHLVTQEWREPDPFADLCGAWNRIYIASQLRTGVSFWISLAAIYWAAIHQTLVRVIRGRGWLGHLKAYAIALGNFRAIRAGDFKRLYATYEKPSGLSK
jgi:glycosyltransferase involved in cell wall biosynthesis